VEKDLLFVRDDWRRHFERMREIFPLHFHLWASLRS
jgi:hypothetical protein